MINTIELQRVPSVPWRNGGGMTQELLAWPSPTDWQFRISVARIESDGPFSAYPDVERWLAVVQGEGVRLRFPEREIRLTVGNEVVRFEGGQPPGCELLNGPTSDLNLMVRQQAGRGQLSVAATGEDWTSTAALRAVFTMRAATLQIDDTDVVDLAGGTLAWSASATRQRWQLANTRPECAWWLQFAAV